MGGPQELKKVANIRLRTVRILIKAEDWDGAAYMMGYVLECALKAAVCKALHLKKYPDLKSSTTSEKINRFFMTHEFDVLLTVSGLEDIFGYDGLGFNSWSGFTQEYKGIWTGMRYDIGSWDKKKTKNIYNFLVGRKEGLLSLIERNHRW